MSFYLLHRGWMDNEIFSNEPFTDRLAWVWLIQEASFEPHKIRYKNKMIQVGIGQVPISYRRLVAKWKWGIHRVRNFLQLLQSEAMISLETATGFLIITICNYEKYQKPQKISTTLPTTVTATQATTLPTTNINKGKELKEIKEKKESKTTGSRFALADLPDDWRLFCQEKRPDLNPDEVFFEFRDYWIAVPGQKGRKTDWSATWRNRVRNKRMSDVKHLKSFTDTSFDQKEAISRVFKSLEKQAIEGDLNVKAG